MASIPRRQAALPPRNRGDPGSIPGREARFFCLFVWGWGVLWGCFGGGLGGGLGGVLGGGFFGVGVFRGVFLWLLWVFLL